MNNMGSLMSILMLYCSAGSNSNTAFAPPPLVALRRCAPVHVTAPSLSTKNFEAPLKQYPPVLVRPHNWPYQGRHQKQLLKSKSQNEDGSINEQDMTQFNAAIYNELRDHFAVVQEAPTIASKRGGSEIFTYMPPSFREREESQRLLPCPDLTAQEVISTILSAMKANRKFGSIIYLRFMSDKHRYSRVTSEELQLQLEMGGQTQVLLGNFRSFSFPTPTFEMNVNSTGPVAVQEVKLLVPGFMAAMMGASRGWTAEARLRWQLSQDSNTKAWLVDSCEIIPCAEDMWTS